jgi:hypothetical protein
MLENSWVAEGLAGSQEGLGSVESVSELVNFPTKIK